jgi:hypothetical protein
MPDNEIRFGSNRKQEEIGLLRNVALNEALGPLPRIKAALDLLLKFGPSSRNVPVIRKVISLFVSDADNNVQERAEKLRAKLAKRLALKSVVVPENTQEFVDDDDESLDLNRSPDVSHRGYLTKDDSVVVPDGYEKDLLNFHEVIARVIERYGSASPKPDSIELLTTALGTIPLDGHSARQLWLCLAYRFKEVGGAFDLDHYASKLLPLQAIWIQTALCYYGNRNDLGLGSNPSVPNCFIHVLDQVGFCC